MIHRLHVPVIKPEDVVPHLGKQEAHWRQGYSAQELAVSWVGAANDFPPRVKSLLQSIPEYKGAELVDAFFEREVRLDTDRANSQTDLMVVAGISDHLAMIAVEGKVDESFDLLVGQWNQSSGKQSRLEYICRTLELDPAQVSHLRYQLLHRTASAIYEAKRYRCVHAIMLVHSFSSVHRGFEDFAAFARSLGIEVEGPDNCSETRFLDGVSLRLAWVSDQPHQ